jgi:hypothetical protein
LSRYLKKVVEKKGKRKKICKRGVKTLAKGKKIIYNIQRLRMFRCLFYFGRDEESRSGL